MIGECCPGMSHSEVVLNSLDSMNCREVNVQATTVAWFEFVFVQIRNLHVRSDLRLAIKNSNAIR